MSIKFFVSGGGGIFGFGGGGCRFYFYGRGHFSDFALLTETIGNGRNTVSSVLFRKRELTEFCSKLGEFWEKLGEFALAHTNRRLKGTH